MNVFRRNRSIRLSFLQCINSSLFSAVLFQLFPTSQTVHLVSMNALFIVTMATFFASEILTQFKDFNLFWVAVLDLLSGGFDHARGKWSPKVGGL